MNDGSAHKPLIMKRHGGLTSLILLLSSHRTPSNSKKDKRERYKHQLLGVTIIISHSQEHAKRREEKKAKTKRTLTPSFFPFAHPSQKKHPDKTLYPTRCIVVLRLSFLAWNPHPSIHTRVSLFSLHIYHNTIPNKSQNFSAIKLRENSTIIFPQSCANSKGKSISHQDKDMRTATCAHDNEQPSQHTHTHTHSQPVSAHYLSSLLHHLYYTIHSPPCQGQRYKVSQSKGT